LPVAPKTAPPAKFQLHPLSITRILWKSKFTLLGIWLSLSLVCVAIVHELPAIYRAECLLLVVEQKIPDKYVSATVNTDPQLRLAAVSHLILSNQHLQNVIDAFGLYKKESESMTKDELINRMREKDITLKLESGLSNTRPDAFRISYEAKDPKLAADVANRLATMIISENSRTRENQAEDTSQFIGAELQQAKETLDGLEARVGQWKLSHNGELPEQENALSSSLASLQVKLQGNQEALNRSDQSRTLNANNLSLAESSLATLERSAEEAREQAKHVRSAPVETVPVEAPARPKTRREILKEELASLSQRYGDEHPEIRRRKAELAELPPDKEEPPAPKRVTATPQPNNQEVVPASIQAAIIAGKERIASLRVQIELSNKEFEAAKQERVRIVHELEATQARIDRLPIREQQMAALTRDYEMAKEHYKSMLDRKLSASMATDLERSEQGERFTIIDRARIPDQPYKPPRTVLYIVSVISSLLIGAAGILARRLPKDTMLGEWELTPGVVVLGRVPMIEASQRGLTSLPHGANS
jgi:protein tyrosine kinase modulator